MSKYLELVEGSFNESHFNKQTNQNPYVAYSIQDDKVIYTIISSEEPDPLASFVDLGLSVMWASCDVGASSPEGVGTKYEWGLAYKDDIPLDSDPVYINSDIELKEFLRPRTPSPDQVQELFDNTTATDEVLNGVEGVRYTAANGNSIFISNAERWTNAEKWKVTQWSTSQAVHWSPNEGIIDNDPGEGFPIYKSDLLLFRGICSCLPRGGAQVLKHGTEIVLEDTLYCFPKTTWTATQIMVDTKQPVKMYISNTADFEKSSEDSRVITTSLSVLENDSHQVIYLSDQELSNLDKQATEDFLYVRFSCPSSTEAIIDKWAASACSNKSYMIHPNVPQFIDAKSRSVIYRLRYADFVGYDLTINWGGVSTLPTYISEICDYIPSTNNAALLLKPAPSIKAGSTYVIEASTIAEWASRVSAEGYIYARFNPNFAGYVTFQTSKPVEEDPVPITIE